MIVQATSPARISLFGGGTDIPGYADKFGGLVISMAINLRQHVTLYTDDNIYSITENRLPYDTTPTLIHAVTKEFGLGSMHHAKYEVSFDGVIGAGLGSSGAVCVAMIGAINKAKGLGLTRDQIAEKAYEIESNFRFGGKQDQYASVYGGVNAIKFEDKVTVTPLSREFIEDLYPYLVLIYIGKRKSAKIQEGLRKISKEQFEYLHKIRDLAVLSIEAIGQGNIETVGSLLNESWDLKKRVNKTSNNKIDQFYTRGIENGAYGGKLLGAGGGGYMLFIVDPKNRDKFIYNMGENTDFSIDWNGLDTRIL